MNKEQLQFFYDEIMGMFGWEDGDTASGVDPLLWAKKQIRDKDAKLAQLRAENERLVNTLNEWGESYKKIINDGGCSDEQHCSCVPVLRAELAAANKAVDEARELITKVSEKTGRHSRDPLTHASNIIEDNADAASAWLTAHPAKEGGE